jgi:hypothetical protein
MGSHPGSAAKRQQQSYPRVLILFEILPELLLVIPEIEEPVGK